MLWNVRPDIHVKWDNKEEGSWSLENDIYVSLRNYRDYMYLHIRQWSPEGYPTKNGVTFTWDEWQQFTAQMKPPFDALLQATSAAMRAKRKEDCEGCKIDAPNQLAHDCLMSDLTNAETYFETCYNSVTREDFITYLPLHFWADSHWMQTIVLNDQFQAFKSEEKDNIYQEIKKIWV